MGYCIIIPCVNGITMIMFRSAEASTPNGPQKPELPQATALFNTRADKLIE
jgi:hypothetical protein